MITSNLNKRAWEIRKNAAAKLGCRVMEIVWGICYRQAKEEIMAENKKPRYDIEKLKKLGNEWKKTTDKCDYHRIYFDDLEELVGIEYSQYKTGNISNAKLDGERISNSAARDICSALNGSKFWYDVKTEEFSAKLYPCRNYDLLEMLIDGITEKLNEK